MVSTGFFPRLLGQMMWYRLSEADANYLRRRILIERLPMNAPSRGEMYPAIIVRQFPPDEDGRTLVNLQVFLDGPITHHVTSRRGGTEEGEWKVTEWV